MRGRIRKLFNKVMAQGISPHKLALTFAIGIVVGFLPLVWGSTLLCALLAFFFRLNQPGIQAANYLAYPLQIALFFPFYRMGARVFPWGPYVSVELLAKGLRKDFGGDIVLLAVATLKAVAAWLLVAPPAALLLYVVLRSIFTRMPALKGGASAAYATFD